MIKRNHEYASLVKETIPALSTIHGSLTIMASRKYVTREALVEWLAYVTKHHDQFTAFKTESGAAFEAEHADASAELDATIASLATIKAGLQAKIDALDAEEEAVASPPTWPRREKKETDEQGRDIYDCSNKATMEDIMARVPDQADEFSASATLIIKNELEDVPVQQLWG
jgi:hypothetical protein